MIGYIVFHLCLYKCLLSTLTKNEWSIITCYKQLISKHFWIYYLHQNFAGTVICINTNGWVAKLTDSNYSFYPKDIIHSKYSGSIFFSGVVTHQTRLSKNISFSHSMRCLGLRQTISKHYIQEQCLQRNLFCFGVPVYLIH